MFLKKYSHTLIFVAVAMLMIAIEILWHAIGANSPISGATFGTVTLIFDILGMVSYVHESAIKPRPRKRRRK